MSIKNFLSNKVVLSVLVLLVVVIIFLWIRGVPEEEAKGPIVVGSKIDTEGALLGNIIAGLLEDNGFAVTDRIQTGTTPIVREAIITGEIDIYPEYTGNGFYFFSGATEVALWKSPKSAWETVKKLDYEENKLVWLTPAPANNTWAIAVRKDLSEAENLVTLEDLAGYINRDGYFKIAGSEEFVSSEAALPSFEQGYSFKLTDDQMLVLSSGNTALTEQAAARQTDGVNAAMAYGTDGQLAAYDLIVLEDTKGVQPVYEPAPIIREAVLLKYPEIEDILKQAFIGLDLVTLQGLNSRIAVDGEAPSAVAEDYLGAMD